MAAARALHDYLTTGPEAETDLRSVVLFGRNAASYKFALAESLFDHAKNGHQSVSLEELAEPYTSHMVEHARHAPRQAVNPSSAFVMDWQPLFGQNREGLLPEFDWAHIA